MSLELISKRMIVGISMAMALILPQISHADLMLKLSDLTGPAADVIVSEAGAGTVHYAGAYGAFGLTINLGTSDPFTGTKASPNLNLDSLTILGGIGGLSVTVTDTDFDAHIAPDDIAFNMFGSGFTDGSVTVSYYLDSGNTAFGMGTLLGTYSDAAGLIDFTDKTASMNPAGPYSLTIVADIYHTSFADQTDFQSQINAVPEPGTFVLLGLGLVSLGFYRKKRN